MHEQPAAHDFGSPHSFETVTTCRVCAGSFHTRGMALPPLRKPIVPTICPTCEEERGRAAVNKERAARNAQKDEARAKHERAWERLCPKEYRLTSENAGNTELARLELACPLLKRILTWVYAGRGLVLRSRASGKCKTRAMWRLLRKQFVEGRSIGYYTAGSFQRRAQDEAGKYTIDAWFNTIAALDIFFLDDLGKGFWTENTEAIFFDLTEHRTSQGRPTMVTTNYSPEELARGSRSEATTYTLRRLNDYCETIEL